MSRNILWLRPTQVPRSCRQSALHRLKLTVPLEVLLPVLRNRTSLVLSDPGAGARDLNTCPEFHRRGLALQTLAVDRVPTSERWAVVAPRLRVLFEGGLLEKPDGPFAPEA